MRKISVCLCLFLLACCLRSFAQYSVAPTDRSVRSKLGVYSTNKDSGCADSGPRVDSPLKNTFGEIFTRLTDGCAGPSFTGPVNYWFNYFSVPGRAYLPNQGRTVYGYDVTVPEVNGAGSVLFKLNPNTMQAYRWCNSAWTNCLMPYTGEFSYVTPGLLYFSGSEISTSDETEAWEYNYDTSAGPTLVYDFKNCPGLTSVSGANTGAGAGTLYVSHNDSAIANWMPDNNTFVVYNRNTGACNWLDIYDGTYGGSNGSGKLNDAAIYNDSTGTFHTTAVNADGSWVYFQTAYPQNGLYSFFWEVGTANAGVCQVYDWCGGHMAVAQSKAFYVISEPNTGGVPPHYDYGSFSIANYSNESASNVTHLLPTGPPTFNPSNPDGTCNVTDTHPNWNQGSDSAPIIVSSFVDETPPSGFSLMQIVCPWDHEIDAVASDGSGKVWRFMHNRADGLATPTSSPDTNYNALSMPSCSKDGKICIFATDWQQALGSYQGLARTDVFAIQMK
jgi:hypothetical protein